MTNSQGHEAWGVGGVRLVAQVHLAIGLRQPVRPVLSLNASHAVLKCSLASLRLLALPNGGPGCALGRPDPDARRALAGVADATDKPKGGGP